MPIQNKSLEIGDRAPDFSLTDAASGATVSLDELLGRSLLIMFGRGTW
jgi:peroxiredoxin